jgi:hypothetical protein
MHQSYEERTKHKADFRVKYRFYKPEEGGRMMLPYQGIRSDFWYEHPENKENSVFIIWPEFEDEDQNLILDETVPVPETGTARMWVIMNKMREYHKDKIKTGTKGYFLEGKRTAECEVIEIIDLMENPIE